MTPDEFRGRIAELTKEIANRPLDSALQDHLNTVAAPDSETYRGLFDACREAIAEGWMCNREAGGIRYGRVLKADPATHGFSVDVVDMDRIVGPHHAHPNGEIDLVMPLTPAARFDGQAAGWKVYEPGTAHHPTVTEAARWCCISCRKAPSNSRADRRTRTWRSCRRITCPGNGCCAIQVGSATIAKLESEATNLNV